MSEKQQQSRFNRLRNRGTELLRRGRPEQATSYLERAQKIDANDFDVNLNLSGAYILTKKFRQAVPILENLRDNHPENEMVWTNLGAAYLGNPVLARPEEQLLAISAFEKAYELNPLTPNVAYNLGLIFRDRRNFNQAAKWFKVAVTTNPNDEDAKSLLRRMEQKGADQK